MGKRTTRRKPEEVAAVAQALRQRLKDWEQDADPALIAAALAQHAGYKGSNPLRIAMQDPDATDVRGYRAWQEVGRQVGKYPPGEGGITIIAVGDRAKGNGDASGEAQPEGQAPAATGGEQTTGGGRWGAMISVHDVRWTFQVFCAVEGCGLPIHLVAKEKAATRKLQWTHTGRRNVGHEARQPKPTGEVMVPQAPETPVPARLADLDEVEGLAGEGLDEIEV